MISTGRLVLAEPDPALRRVLAQRLESEGYEVRPFESLRDSSELDFDFVDAVLAAALPQDAPLAELREHSDVPVVALLPRETPSIEAVEVLDAGADDFVVKPFSPRELIARLNAVLRRARPPREVPSLLEFGDGLTIDARVREVVVRGEVVPLPAKVFDLLVFLAQSPRQVFSRAELMSGVWHTDASVTTATVTEHVRRLRQRIEKDPRHPRWITTIWSVGYRFDP